MQRDKGENRKAGSDSSGKDAGLEETTGPILSPEVREALRNEFRQNWRKTRDKKTSAAPGLVNKKPSDSSG